MEKEKPISETKNPDLALLVDLFEQTNSALQKRAAIAVNSSLVIRNWLFGFYISEFEKQTSDRSEIYGKKLIENLSENLTEILGKGYSRRYLDRFRQFYEEYEKIGKTLSAESFPNQITEIGKTVFSQSSVKRKNALKQISHTLSEELDLKKVIEALSVKFRLSWSHYLFLISISDLNERQFYEVEAQNQGWSLRELKRQFNSSLYERLALSRDKAGVKELSQKGQLIDKPTNVIKNPYVLEFLNLDEKIKYSETDLETAIIDKLEHFLLELGKGFLFEARQKRFSFDEEHFYVDLVFYNRLLRCYVLIDLKIGELKHQDLGQMQMYVHYFDRFVKLEDEQPTIGIILCKKKKDSLVEITLPKDANIHAAKYQTYLPDKAELKKQLEEAQTEWDAAHE
jgi:predicted nuclease of restriction endonuclease-like (RecB) superfamily